MPVLLDGAQGAGAIPVDVTALGCAAYAGRRAEVAVRRRRHRDALRGARRSASACARSRRPTWRSRTPRTGLDSPLRREAPRADAPSLPREAVALSLAATRLLAERRLGRRPRPGHRRSPRASPRRCRARPHRRPARRDDARLLGGPRPAGDPRGGWPTPAWSSATCRAPRTCAPRSAPGTTSPTSSACSRRCDPLALRLRPCVRGSRASARARRRQVAVSWWRRGALYQVYPRSFQDSDGDGVGDLEGIRAAPAVPDVARRRRRLAVAVLPLADGRLRLRHLRPLRRRPAVRHARRTSTRWPPRRSALGLELILDYVPNHTSDRAPVVPRAGRDCYLWRDAGRRTTGCSVFGGPAWTRDASGRFYYHAYLPEQPDLNWRNPDVRAAMLDVLRFWRERGADGFRIDALRQVIKDDRLARQPAEPRLARGRRPVPRAAARVHDRPPRGAATSCCAMREAAGRRTRLLLGELYLPIERLMAYYGYGLDLPANFHLLRTPWTRARRRPALIERLRGARCRTARGRTGCSATTTARGSPRASARRRRASPRCCCSRCAARRRSTTATSSACADVADPARARAGPVGAARARARPGATRRARRCSGTTAEPASAPREPWLPLRGRPRRASTSPPSATTRARCSRCTGGCSGPAAGSSRSRPTARSAWTATCSSTPAGTRSSVALNLGADEQAVALRGRVLAATDASRAGDHVGAETRLRGGEGVVVMSL